MIDVHAAVGIGAYRQGPVAAEGPRGGIGAVGGIGDEDFRPFLPRLLEVFFKDHDAGKLPVGAGGGLEGEIRHPEDLAQILSQFIHELEAALGKNDGGVRMQAGEAGELGHVLVDLGVVFHRAGA